MNALNNWTPPTPLRSDKSGLRNFPVDALPPILQDMASSVACTTSTDPAMASTAILSSASYCFSGVYRMTGKSDHTEPLVLDTLIVAEPSMLKSPVISAIKRPYTSFTHDWNEQNKTDIFRRQAEKKILESQLIALEKKDDVTADEIADLQTKISNMESSGFRRIVVDDVTPEALVNLLSENGTLLMMSDEAGMLANFGGRYSNNTPNVDLLLKSWNGETHTSDRVGNIGQRRYNTQPISESVIEGYKKLIYKLLHDKFRYHDENEIFLHFDSKAFGEFVDFYNGHIEKQLITDMAFCRDWGGKYHGLILRLCGIIHCVKCALDGKNPAEIHPEYQAG